MLEDILLKVRKPARYLGNEWNVCVKDFDRTFIRLCLAFPDIYDVGMSNLGLRIIYGLLNETEDVLCERVFHPAPDLEQILRKRSLKLFSLESKKNLFDFDIIGFSIGYELCFSNVLNLLDLAGIPLRSESRDDRYPLVIAGGGCALNPEPLSDFIDLFVIGEAEEVILEIIDVYRKLKLKSHPRRPKRKEVLNGLKNIPGIYIPSFYQVSYHKDGTIRKFSPQGEDVPRVIRKRFLERLDSSFYPIKWLLPFSEIIHDRIPLEIMRGCPNKCRFCQAKALYFPYRYKGPENIIDLAKAIYRVTGYNEISLMGLSVSDYYKVRELTGDLIDIFKEKGVSLSLASIRAKSLVGDLITYITEVKKTGLTFAPEAATERLRKIINKDFDIQAFFAVVRAAYKLGYQHIKLYFMIGLPQETNKDLDSIIDLSLSVLKLKKELDNRSAWVNVSIANLIPKPHTPFQWLAMEDINHIEKKQYHLRSHLKNKGHIKLSFHNRYVSFMECLLTRGDRRLCPALLRAWQKGARFDAWDEHFSFSRWMQAFKESHLDPNFYVSRKYEKDEILPWDFIDTGISKKALRLEFEKVGIK